MRESVKYLDMSIVHRTPSESIALRVREQRAKVHRTPTEIFRHFNSRVIPGTNTTCNKKSPAFTEDLYFRVTVNYLFRITFLNASLLNQIPPHARMAR